jgi:hypothetical protein
MPVARLRVSENRRFLITEDGKPFFYLGDTAWELFHRLNREEVIRYLDKRAAQGFNVIQAVALAEVDGLTEPNAYGKLPLVDKDPLRPNIMPGSRPDTEEYDYWDHVDFVFDEAQKRGLYIAFLPTWANWVNNERLFTTVSAQSYGEFLGRRYGKRSVIWVMGGDRTASGVEDIWRAMARGIATGVSGREDYDMVLMTFHPVGRESSSTWFHNEPWLGFNMQQTGHRKVEVSRTIEAMLADYARTPVKPALDGEPLYEDHPIRPKPEEDGYSFDAHVRQRVYWSVFAGGCGVTYGHHSVWQMYGANRKPVSGPLFTWEDALDRPGANQMRHLRTLIESRPMLSRVPDATLIVDPLSGSEQIVATRGDGYLFVYSPHGREFTVNLGRISGEMLTAHWYSPRDGRAFPTDSVVNRGTHTFRPPSVGFGSDWVLILDDAARRFPLPSSGRNRQETVP